MKKIVLLLLVFCFTTIHVNAASPYYTVPKQKNITSGIYQDGKLILAAKNESSTYPFTITNVVSAGGNLFYTENEKDHFIDSACMLAFEKYELRFRSKSGTVSTVKGANIHGRRGNIGSDGTYVYYVSNKTNSKGDLTRVSSTGKDRKVLVKDVQDFWMSGHEIFYVKNRSFYKMKVTNYQSTVLAIGKGKLLTPSNCEKLNYIHYDEGIAFLSAVTNYRHRFDLYDYATGQSKAMVYKTNDNIFKNKNITTISIEAIDFKNGNYLVSEDHSLFFRDVNGKTLKKVVTLPENLYDPYLFFEATYLKSIYLQQGKLTYLKGKKLYTKFF